MNGVKHCCINEFWLADLLVCKGAGVKRVISRASVLAGLLRSCVEGNRCPQSTKALLVETISQVPPYFFSELALSLKQQINKVHG